MSYLDHISSCVNLLKVSLALGLICCRQRNRCRPLPHRIADSETLEETKTLFEKLSAYCGRSISNLITAGSEDNDRYVFRMIGSRIYYVPLSLANLATSIPRDCLLSMGTAIGKLTKTGKMRVRAYRL